MNDSLSQVRVVGRNGVVLEEKIRKRGWTSYLGVTTQDMPNFGTTLGSNTALGHNSIVLMIEAEVAYIVSYLRQMKTCGATVSLLKPSVEEAFMEEMRGRMRSTVWETGGCRSWYLSSPSEKHSNTTTVLWPGHVQVPQQAFPPSLPPFPSLPFPVSASSA